MISILQKTMIWNEVKFSQYISLTKTFAWADFKLRFHGSAIGILWSVIRPLFFFSVVFVVISVFIKANIPNYAVSLLLGIILWGLFADATIFSIVSIEEKAGLIKKIYFPRSIIVVSATLTACISFLFNAVIFVLLFFLSPVVVHITALLVFVYLLLLVMFSIGVGFIISALFAKMKDVRTIWEMLLQLGSWITPLVYSVSIVPEKFVPLVYLNPMARIVEYSRWALLEGRLPKGGDFFVLFAMCTVTLFCGYVIFTMRSRRFAEEL